MQISIPQSEQRDPAVERLLLVARELERVAARVSLIDFLASGPDERHATWSFNSPSGSVVLRDGRVELGPPDAL